MKNDGIAEDSKNDQGAVFVILKEMGDGRE